MRIRLGCLAAGTPEDERLRTLAGALDLPLVNAADAPTGFSHWLCFREGRLCLAGSQAHAPAPTCVDFDSGAIRHRRATSGKSQGIGLAVGVKKLGSPLVLDATAGLGRDAFILASLGCRVQLLERSPVVHALLEDGMRRAGEDADIAAILERMTLYTADARQWLREIIAGDREKPDVVYLDPMFPSRGGTAKVKKDISLLQQLLGPDEDFEELLGLARACARHRIVVKRPGGKSRGESPPSNFQVEGKSSHFDIYLPV